MFANVCLPYDISSEWGTKISSIKYSFWALTCLRSKGWDAGDLLRPSGQINASLGCELFYVDTQLFVYNGMLSQVVVHIRREVRDSCCEENADNGLGGRAATRSAISQQPPYHFLAPTSASPPYNAYSLISGPGRTLALVSLTSKFPSFPSFLGPPVIQSRLRSYLHALSTTLNS